MREGSWAEYALLVDILRIEAKLVGVLVSERPGWYEVDTVLGVSGRVVEKLLRGLSIGMHLLGEMEASMNGSRGTW